MKKLLLLGILSISFICLTAFNYYYDNTIGAGQQPQVSIDPKGAVRVIFGSADQIFCATSTNHGVTFGKPVLVAKIPEMHLGMARGPQLNSSKNFSLVTAIDKTGNIHWYILNHISNKWRSMGVLNDQRGSAPEGLMSIAADDNDHFYAAWLDTRTGKHNQLYFSSLTMPQENWSKNIMAYKSPDQHVCECCKPTIAVNGSSVAIMFRNWLNGSRDLYVTRSPDKGRTFSAAQKIGLDTWKLNGCPMDGGGLRISPKNVMQTVWQRKGNIYFAIPGDPEVHIAKGRNCSIAGSGLKTLITYQNNDTLNVISLPKKTPQTVGIGSYLKAAPVNATASIYVWERDKQIKYRRM